MDTGTIENSLIVIKGSRLCARVVNCFSKPTNVVAVGDLGTLIEMLSQHVGATLLLDLSLFDEDVEHPALKTIFQEGAEQKIIVVTDEQRPGHLYKLFRQGVRGFCPSKTSDELLVKAVNAVGEGELWIGRKLTGYLMSQLILERSRTIASFEQLNDYELTPRESEIAHHVARGKCDKIIARDLAISPNTVKNHLSHIFNKLQIADRYQLALIYHGIDVG